MNLKTKLPRLIPKTVFGIAFFLLCTFSLLAQQSSLMIDKEHYYYIGAETTNLKPYKDHYYIAVNRNISNSAQLSTALGKDIEVLQFVDDFTAQTLRPLSKKSEKAGHWAEVKLKEPRSKDAYMKYAETLKSNTAVDWCSPFFTNQDGDRIGVSQYFYVKLKNETDLELLERESRKNATFIVGQNKFMPLWYTLKCVGTSPKTTLQIANTFYETGLFEFSEPAIMVDDFALCINDPLFPNQWGWNNTAQNGGIAGVDVNACAAWDIAQGSRDVVVAILDHGFEMNHPDLQGNTFGVGYNTVTGTSPASVLGNHGTPCAGIVGAIQDNNTGVSGIAPKLQLMSVSTPLLLNATAQQELANGINWAWMNGADVISNSWGHNGLTGSLISNAITNALNNGRGGLGTIMVFAAGNSNGPLIFPASSNPDIIAVGAVDDCGLRIDPTGGASCLSWNGFNGSCFGSQLDVVAPGTLISTTDRQGALGYSSTDYTPSFNGTSSACPAVAGIAGLMLSINPCFTHDQVEDLIESTAQKTGTYAYANTAGRPNGTWHQEVGYGMVDALAATIEAVRQLPTGSNFDLIVKDRPFDTGLEPNPDPGPMWISDDIWVRKNLDGGLTHENPEFKMFSPNGVYVRVTNNGPTTSPCSALSLFFSKASTGLVWANHWINFNVGPVKYGDLINVVSIPPIAPGGTYIAEVPWYPPNPADFPTDIHHFCLLARVISPSDPMFNEQIGIGVNPNVRNNNNIAWKNVSVYDLQSGNLTGGGTSVFVRGVNDGDNHINLRFWDEGFKDNVVYPFFDRGGTIKVRVDDVFYDRIAQADLVGVEMLGNSTLSIQKKGARINKIYIKGSETFMAEFFFTVDDIGPGEEVLLDLVQENAYDGELEGGERFVIRYPGTNNNLNMRKAITSLENTSFAYPNPTTNNLYVDYEVLEENASVDIRINSLSGQVVQRYQEGLSQLPGKYTVPFDVSTLVPGVYFIHLQVGEKVQTQKIIIGF